MADATFDVPTLEGVCRRVLIALGTPEDLASTVATTVAVEAARSVGVGMVTIRSCNHIGRLGEYVTEMARLGHMGMAFCNAGAAVAPFGGAGRVLGTNPFAWSVPRRGEEPIFADFATSGIAEGKLNIARGEGRSVAPGYVIDSEGRPTTNPEDFYAGGALLPFGAHKGSAMSMLIELSAGLLSGMGASCMPTFGGGNGTLFMAADVGAFMPLDEYVDQVDVFCSELDRRAAPRDGGEVLLPGEVEFRTKASRGPDHIPVGAGVRRSVTVLARELGVDIGDFAVAG